MLRHLVALSMTLGLVCLGLFHHRPANPAGSSRAASIPVAASHDSVRAAATIATRQGCFVPNLGQWQNPSSFVHRRGSMSMFLEKRGWVLDLHEPPKFERVHSPGNIPEVTPRKLSQKNTRGVALRMTFVGATDAELVGESRLTGHYNYFLGNDRDRWRTEVPRYATVLCKGLYLGVDVRVRTAGGHPEYDVLLAPWADISEVRVEVEGADSLRIGSDGALVIETVMGPVTQPMPRTWQVSADGEKRSLACHYVLLGPRRFGFAVPCWDGGSRLTIDPGLIWSTFLGGDAVDATNTVAVDSRGFATVAGLTGSLKYPTTTGAYNLLKGGGSDAVVTQLDPNRKPASSQLVFSTFIGGSANEATYGLYLDDKLTITIVGDSYSKNYPTTAGAFTGTNSGNTDVFVSRLDPSKSGTAQLLYSTLLGGQARDIALATVLDSAGRVMLTGVTDSSSFPTTAGAFDSTFNGVGDVFVAVLDPSLTGLKQLSYSTLIGGRGLDTARSIATDSRGFVTIAGDTLSSLYPVTSNPYDSTYHGHDVFVTRLDPRKSGSAQLVYSTFVSAHGEDGAVGMTVDANGVVTIGGYTSSADFPTTKGAFDSTFNGVFDVFVSRLDPRLPGKAQLLFSTYMGGSLSDHITGIEVDANGIVTFGGACNHVDFPTTPNALSRLWNGHNDAIIVRLDPNKQGAEQVLYSSYLGGTGYDGIHAIDLTGSGTVITAGHTRSADHPTTVGAYSRKLTGPEDIFVNHLELDVQFWANHHRILRSVGGIQELTLNAGTKYAGMPYLIAGSASGTHPGITLSGVHIPLNVDTYTRITMGTGAPVFNGFRGVIDSDGRASASLNLPPTTFGMDLTLFHSYVVYDTVNGVLMASNSVPVELR